METGGNRGDDTGSGAMTPGHRGRTKVGGAQHNPGWGDNLPATSGHYQCWGVIYYLVIHYCNYSLLFFSLKEQRNRITVAKVVNISQLL